MALKSLGALVAPLLICCALLTALLRGVDVYDALLTGARRGLRTAVDILPALLVLNLSALFCKHRSLPERCYHSRHHTHL